MTVGLILTIAGGVAVIGFIAFALWQGDKVKPDGRGNGGGGTDVA